MLIHATRRLVAGRRLVPGACPGVFAADARTVTTSPRPRDVPGGDMACRPFRRAATVSTVGHTHLTGIAASGHAHASGGRSQ